VEINSIWSFVSFWTLWVVIGAVMLAVPLIALGSSGSSSTRPATRSRATTATRKATATRMVTPMSSSSRLVA
jgi:hypothetical protein